jgi:hypothetical protein
MQGGQKKRKYTLQNNWSERSACAAHAALQTGLGFAKKAEIHYIIILKGGCHLMIHNEWIPKISKNLVQDFIKPKYSEYFGTFTLVLLEKYKGIFSRF